jgi:hypothetical protein
VAIVSHHHYELRRERDAGASEVERPLMRVITVRASEPLEAYRIAPHARDAHAPRRVHARGVLRVGHVCAAESIRCARAMGRPFIALHRVVVVRDVLSIGGER